MTIDTSPRGFLRSTAMQTVARGMEAAIGSRGGVLICGEPGTGREITARAIHRASTAAAAGSLDDLLRACVHGHDSDAPFIVVDCAAGRDLEARLFGQPSAGAAGPELDRVCTQSLLYQSFGGTIFLRSVHEMPGRVQARLARILRDGEVWVDTRRSQPLVAMVNVRVIASIDTCLREADDRIVPDLHRRLEAHRIALPPLRERREDIPALVRWILADACASLKIPPKAASRQAVALMAALPWTGNFTEMRGLLRALALKSRGRLVRVSDVLECIRLDGGGLAFMGGGTLREARERFEREYVAAVLAQHRGRMAEAARALGLQRTNLYRKVRQLSVARRNGGSPKY